MDKVLESLERLKTAPSFMGGTVEYQSCTDSKTLLIQDYEIVKQAVLELKSIKESNSTEGLNKLEELKYNIQDEIRYHYSGYVCCKEETHKYDEDFKIIERALIKTKMDLEELGCSLEEIIEFVKLLKKVYYIDYVTGLLSERWSPLKSNEKEICKLNQIFYKIKDKDKSE